MYKSRLQEICHQRHWTLPTYSSAKDGSDHQPRFKGVVVVNGRTFESPNFSKSSKEAQNEAAGVAFQHFAQLSPLIVPGSTAQNEAGRTDLQAASSSAPPVSYSTAQNEAVRTDLQQFTLATLAVSSSVSSSAPPDSFSTGSSSASTSDIPNCNGVLLRNTEELSNPHQSPGNTLSVKNEGFGDTQYVFKSLLQNYVQKRSLSLPVYSSIREGSAHAPCFKAMVTVEGQTFESPEFYRTLKEAEQLAAKIALSSFTSDDNQEDDYAPYKNLLQVLTQKEGFKFPVYTSIKSGSSHMPTFSSTVEVDGKVFHGKSAKTKKEAEMMAAKVAYLSLKERHLSKPPSPLSQFGDEKEAPDFSFSSSASTLAVELQQKLSIGCSSPAQRYHDSKDGDQEADSAERIIKRGKAITNHQTPSPTKPQTGFERLAVTVPSVSPKHRESLFERLQVTVPSVTSTVQCSSSSTPVQRSPEPLVHEPKAYLPAQTIKISCDRVVVYPKKQYMEIQDKKDITVLPISNDDWVAVSLDCPN